MSVDFNGTTSRLQHTTATGYDVGTLTICAWLYADGQGEGSLGRVLTLPEAGTTFLAHQNAANTLLYQHDWNTTDGVWTFPATDGQWNAVALSYDGSSTSNDPVARVNFSNVTVTRVTGPATTLVSIASGYCIGNNSGQTRTWDGAIAHLQFFKVILTADEMDAALRVPGSVGTTEIVSIGATRGLVSWWPLWHATYTADMVNHSFQPTATALTTRVGPPIASPWGLRHRGWRGASGGAVARGLRRPSNLDGLSTAGSFFADPLGA